MLALVRRVFGLSIALLTSMLCAVAQAAWPGEPTVNVPVSTAVDDQYTPAITSDGAGGAIVAWKDKRAGTDFDIYAQRISAAGVPLWAANGVALCTSAHDQSEPAITADGEGGAIVTWADARTGPYYGVYAQRVNAAGVPLWTPGGAALCATWNLDPRPKIISDGTGGAIVTWWDFRTGYFAIWAQRVNAAGQWQWNTNGVAICASSNISPTRFPPTIASDAAGGAIITWWDTRTGNYNIYMQRVNPAGAPQWTTDGVAVCAEAGGRFSPQIVADGSGGAIVVWQDVRSATPGSGIYAQRVNGSGALQWDANGQPVCNLDEKPVQIASDGGGGAVITWDAARGSTGSDVYAQRLDAAGAPQWTDQGVPLCTAPNDQQFEILTADGAGGTIVTWCDTRNGNSDIYAQRLSASGLPQWTSDGVAICTAANDQRAPAIVATGTGAAIIGWDDARSDSADVYVQKVNANGTLGDTLLTVPPQGQPIGFALHGAEPNPSVGDLRVSFSLLDNSPAEIALYDLTGRRVESLAVEDPAPGPRLAMLSKKEARLPAGIYCLSLTQGAHRAFSKVAIVR